jgi:hypothetical protein
MRNPRLASRCVLGLALIVLAAVPVAAQTRGAPSSGGVVTSTAGLVEVLDPWGERPTLRFRLGHEHKSLLFVDYCYGDLYLSATTLKYVVAGAYGSHSFEIPRSQLTNVKRWSVGLELVWPGKKYHVLLYPLNAGHTQQVLLLVPPVDPNYTSPEPLEQALADFPKALEQARASLPKPAPPPEPPKPPSVILLEPAGADTQTVEVRDEKVTVRGVALDPKGVALVRVGAQLAAMQPRSPQAMEFWVENFPLQPGLNEIEVAAINLERLEGKLTLKVQRVEQPAEPPKPTGLSLEEVLKLLDAGVTPARLETIVKDRGIAFELTDENKKKLRDAGATDALLVEIATAKR